MCSEVRQRHREGTRTWKRPLGGQEAAVSEAWRLNRKRGQGRHSGQRGQQAEALSCGSEAVSTHA